MAKKWSGFVPQNVNAKEQWAMMETLELRSRNLDPREVSAAFFDMEQDNWDAEMNLQVLEG